MAYWPSVPGPLVQGGAEPQGNSLCWLPPAAAYSHSASLGRKPPSQMQKAYASHQFSQLIGRFSWLPADSVNVELGPQERRLVLVGQTLASSVASQPVSKVPPPKL